LKKRDGHRFEAGSLRCRFHPRPGQVAALERLEQPGDLVGVVLQVAVHGDHQSPRQ
jgi:hypothetical protein